MKIVIIGASFAGISAAIASRKKYPQAERCLRDMLHTIRQKHILIVESGCTGTFPMLLMALGNLCIGFVDDMTKIRKGKKVYHKVTL